jgi:type IV secretory pathway TrbD component
MAASESGTNHRGTENPEEYHTEKKEIEFRNHDALVPIGIVFSVWYSSGFSVPMWFVPL